MISFSSAERETIKPTLALDFTIRLNPPVKSIILRGEPIIFRLFSKRERVAADHLKRCSSICRNTATQTGYLTEAHWALPRQHSASWQLFSRRDLFDIRRSTTKLHPHIEAGERNRTSDLRHPKQSFNCCYRLFLMEKVVWNRKRFVHITFFTLHIYYNIFFLKNQKRFF